MRINLVFFRFSLPYSVNLGKQQQFFTFTHHSQRSFLTLFNTTKRNRKKYADCFRAI